ncbi:hypothetical protein TEA_014395 [Camellia sinensis var. sinensis]|uniref:Uncharacterized protein n=1 Tax=Camellia sinensis var. sinensis TaxID=542762 RepID=A0A4S4E7E7_CAMSN|nr:hypothetical protein TEA_014395 [Camellia sinensis var. sinensis]
MWVFDEGVPRFAGGVLLAVVRCFLFVVGLPFEVRLSEGEEDSESRNPFVEYAVQYAVAAALVTLEKDKKDLLHKLLLQGLDITILGCNDFYSYRNQIGKGKVRSGFDVSSAVYGSQRYVRFSLEVLSSAQFKHFADKVIVEEQVERMMSGDAVEPINDGISEFNVEFHCPKESDVSTLSML